MVLRETKRRKREPGIGATAHRDWLRALEATAPIAKEPTRLLFDIIQDVAKTSPDAPALISSDESLTYGELAARANAYARWAIAQGIAKGETVCLMMPNRPEYMAIWLGLSSVGVVVALINTQLRGPSLAHCVSIAGATDAIVGTECCEELCAAIAHSEKQLKIWSHGVSSGVVEHERIDRAISGFSGERLTP